MPSLLVLNKVDRLDAAAARGAPAKAPASGAMLVSAHEPGDVARAARRPILAFFEASMVEETLVVPYAKQALLGDVYESARVVAEEYDESGTRLRVRGLPAAIARLRRAFEA